MADTQTAPASTAGTAADRTAQLAPRVTAATLVALAGQAAVAPERDSMVIVGPATGEPIGQVPRGTADDVAAAALTGRAAQKLWARTPVRRRAAVLLRFAELVLERQDEILDIIQLETGKARRHAFEEVADVAQTCRYYARTAPATLRPRRRTGAMPGLTKVVEHHHPKGLVGIIAPWNYPLTLGVSDALPALVAGNAVLTKPDSATPYSTLWAGTVLEEAGLPPGVFQVVTGAGSQLGDPLVDASDYVMFTGSTAVGRGVAARAGGRLVECSMELGGKNALLVLPDADLDQAVPGTVRASFSNAGQLCISMERIYVHADVWDAFVPRLVEATEGLRLAHAFDYTPDMGSLVSRKQLGTVVDHVADAVAKGAAVLAGGKARPDIGPFFHEPTVLADTTPEMAVFAEETFGPVVSLYRVASEDDAVARANDSDYGLNFSVWTRNRRAGHALATRLEAGTVNINDGYAAAWGSVDAPMGGWKASGIGRRHGRHGLLKYTEAQTVASQRLLPTGPPEFMDPERYSAVLTRALRLMQRIPGVK